MRLYSVIFVTIVAVFAGCSRGPAKISITNGSSITLSNVCVSGEYFAQPLGVMTPGMSMSFALASRNKDNVWVTFEANGEGFNSRGKDRPIYFEVSSRHPLSLAIGPDMNVVSSSENKTH